MGSLELVKTNGCLDYQLSINKVYMYGLVGSTELEHPIAKGLYKRKSNCILLQKKTLALLAL